jgi:hypothetical protein
LSIPISLILSRGLVVDVSLNQFLYSGKVQNELGLLPIIEEFSMNCFSSLNNSWLLLNFSVKAFGIEFNQTFPDNGEKFNVSDIKNNNSKLVDHIS